MLTLTRRIGETITISKNIRLTVTKVNGNRVKLSFEAPKSLSILRNQKPVS